MPARRIVLAAVLAGCALCPLRSEALDAHTLITRCAPTASAGLRGFDAIRVACPGVDQAIASLNVAPLLPAGWQKKATPTALADLDVLARRYAGAASSAAPAASDLRTLALALQQPSSSSWVDSLWERIRDWLRHRLGPADRFLKWFRSLPGWTTGPGGSGALLVGASVLILLGVATFIFVELRAAGLIGAGGRPSSRARRHRAWARQRGEGQLGNDVESMPAPDRPVLALRLLMEALRRSRRIQRDGGLTCRELVARALFDTVAQRERFATVALLAERELYGPDRSPIDMSDEMRMSVQALYSQLLAAPVARPRAS